MAPVPAPATSPAAAPFIVPAAEGGYQEIDLLAPTAKECEPHHGQRSGVPVMRFSNGYPRPYRRSVRCANR